MENINLLPVLTIIITFSTINLFIYFDYDLLQPAVSFFLVMTASLFLGTINITRWNLFVGLDTSLIVISGMFAFAIGAVFLHYNFYKENGAQTESKANIYFGIYDVPWQCIIFCTIFILILAYYNGLAMYTLSIQLGNQNGIMNMIKTLRYPLEQGQIQFSRWINYRNLISMVISTTFLYFFVNNIIICQKTKIKNLLYLLPVAASIPFFIMSTGRRDIIHFIICGVIFYGIIYQQRHGSKRTVRMKILKLLGVTGILALCIYFSLGFLTGKVSIGGKSPLVIISHYGGLSVPALEQYVSSIHPENQYIMQNTMMGFYGNLNSLGFQVESGKDFLPFVEFQGTEYITTNVYTVFYRLLSDYSLLGSLLIMFIFGVLLTWSYNYLKHNSLPGFLGIYSFYGYIPFFLFIDDQFMGLFRTRTIYFCILLVCFIYVMKKKYFHYINFE